MKVISIVGHSGSGKTTLVEKLIRELCVRGVRVATIKHAHHKVELDTPGKDSFRYKDAGAVMSMLLTRDTLQLVADAKVDREPEQLAQRFLGEAVFRLRRISRPFGILLSRAIVDSVPHRDGRSCPICQITNLSRYLKVN